ncbi:VacJ family lipoprotein [Acetobacter thailandicus]|nr:VacJ family lipoprotein [Acetobacter thailandicus]MBS0960289.1 VacJ family lipoprotein [Acetobacter thailandicus]MBS1003227.1 VacJ family lipoprotein [Acetobacter thailandicus]
MNSGRNGARVCSHAQRSNRQNQTHTQARGRFAIRSAVVACSFMMLAGCSSIKAPVPTDPDALADYKQANDPYEPMNRKIFTVTMKVDKWVLHPVAKAYVWSVPHPVRNAIGNMITTMNEPSVFFNDVGAGKPRLAGDAFVRWCINMSAGLGGLIDVAKMAGYPHHNNDAGITMANWGIASGPYLFLPMGPSSFRDGIGYGIDQGLSPWNYVPRGYGLVSFNWAYNMMGIVHSRSEHLDDLDALQRDALDPYATIRSAYQQQRKAQAEAIKNDHRATVPLWYHVKNRQQG